MEQKMLMELQNLLADINLKEIISHLYDGTLLSWLRNWRFQAEVVVAFLVENEKRKSSEKD